MNTVQELAAQTTLVGLVKLAAAAPTFTPEYAKILQQFGQARQLTDRVSQATGVRDQAWQGLRSNIGETVGAGANLAAQAVKTPFQMLGRAAQGAGNALQQSEYNLMKMLQQRQLGLPSSGMGLPDKSPNLKPVAWTQPLQRLGQSFHNLQKERKDIGTSFGEIDRTGKALDSAKSEYGSGLSSLDLIPKKSL